MRRESRERRQEKGERGEVKMKRLGEKLGQSDTDQDSVVCKHLIQVSDLCCTGGSSTQITVVLKAAVAA